MELLSEKLVKLAKRTEICLKIKINEQPFMKHCYIDLQSNT